MKERSSQRKWARLWLKVPIDETMGRSLANESLEKNLCIWGVPQMWAGAEPEGYNLSYSISFKKFFCFNLHEKRCSEASRFKVGSLLSFSNLEVSEIISLIALLQSFWSTMTTPFPLQSFVITTSLFFLRFLSNFYIFIHF